MPRVRFVARLVPLLVVFLLPSASCAQDDVAPAPEAAAEAPAASETVAEPAPEPAPAPVSPLKLRGVTVNPSPVGPDTLCRLSVEIENTGDLVATQFGFSVRVGGSELPVYRNQLFMVRVDPGSTVSIPLYNFWASETGRPWRGGTALPVQVLLTEARWFEIGDDDEGVEVWNPVGPVPGLPIQAAVSVPIAAP